MPHPLVTLNAGPLTIADVVAVARLHAQVALGDLARTRIRQARSTTASTLASVRSAASASPATSSANCNAT
jgi:histidine ammonia-lyase